MFSRIASDMRDEFGMGDDAGAGEGTEGEPRAELMERDGTRPEVGG